jgi:ribonuclease HII
MEQLALEFPQYAWEKNYGYGTAEHMEAIEKYGLTKWHRKSFCSRFLVNN